MSRQNNTRIISVTALCAVLGSTLALPFGAWAQQTEGGMWTQLRLGERLVTRKTNSNDAAEDGTTTQLITDLDLAFSSETRTEEVTLDFGSGFRFVDGPGTDGIETRIVDPALELRYKQTAASASFQIAATASQVDLADVSIFDLASSTDDFLASDFDEITDGGTRTQLGFSTRLSIRDDAPFGLIFALEANDISYTDQPPGTEIDDRSALQVTTTGRFDITPVLQARVGLQYNIVERETTGHSERYRLNARGTLTRPDGDYSVVTNLSDGDGGPQARLGVGRTYVLPQTTMQGFIGVTQSGSDAFYAIGNAALVHDFGDESPLGPLTLSADRSVVFDGDDEEELVTSLSLDASYAVSPLTTMAFNAELGQAENTVTGDDVTLTEVGLSLGYQFGRDWNASAGLRHSQRFGSAAGDTDRDSTTLSLGVSRSFDVRH